VTERLPLIEAPVAGAERLALVERPRRRAADRAGASRRSGVSPSGDRWAGLGERSKPVSEALRTVARAWARGQAVERQGRAGRRSGPGPAACLPGPGDPRGPSSQARAHEGRRIGFGGSLGLWKWPGAGERRPWRAFMGLHAAIGNFQRDLAAPAAASDCRRKRCSGDGQNPIACYGGLGRESRRLAIEAQWQECANSGHMQTTWRTRKGSAELPVLPRVALAYALS
jgi:hypothetical protein